MAEWTNDPTQVGAYNFFLQKGWSPVQAAGIVGGLHGETETLNPTQSHDRGIGLGIAGWNGERLTGLKQFAAGMGMSPTDRLAQLEYVHHELTGPEGPAGQRLRMAQTPADAGNAMLAYFRPKDWDKPGSHPERAQYAQQLYGALGGGTPTQTAAASPAPPTNVLAGMPGGPNVDQLLGMLPKPIQAAPAQLKFNPTPSQPVNVTPPQPVADFTKVAGPVEYPRFVVGQPQRVIDPQGQVRTLHPVAHDPFAGSVG